MGSCWMWGQLSRQLNFHGHLNQGYWFYGRFSLHCKSFIWNFNSLTLRVLFRPFFVLCIVTLLHLWNRVPYFLYLMLEDWNWLECRVELLYLYALIYLVILSFDWLCTKAHREDGNKIRRKLVSNNLMPYRFGFGSQSTYTIHIWNISSTSTIGLLLYHYLLWVSSAHTANIQYMHFLELWGSVMASNARVFTLNIFFWSG